MNGTCPTPNKRIFESQDAAEAFEKSNHATYGGEAQHAYRCDAGHYHLSSRQQFIAGAPQIAESSHWMATRVPEPELPSLNQNDRILEALKKYQGTKTAREIADECGMGQNISVIYTISAASGIPFKEGRVGRTSSRSGAATLDIIQTRREQMLAELALLDQQEEEFRRQEIEKAKVQLQVCDDGANVLISASGQHMRLTPDQYQQLLDKMKTFVPPVEMATA